VPTDKIFIQSVHTRLGQHINSFSQVIHNPQNSLVIRDFPLLVNRKKTLPKAPFFVTPKKNTTPKTFCQRKNVEQKNGEAGFPFLFTEVSFYKKISRLFAEAAGVFFKLSD